MSVMTYEDHPTVRNRRQWHVLSARLILAHLDDDELARDFYIDLVMHESGLPAEAFEMANVTAELFASGYKTPAARERVRKELTSFLEKRA